MKKEGNELLQQILQNLVKERSAKIFDEALQNSNRILTSTREFIDRFLTERSIDPKDICYVAVGSIGRLEALGASDLDLIPVTRDGADLSKIKGIDKELRALLSDELKIKVSKGEDLTSPASLDELIDQQSIGGDKDGSSALTKRILILSESQQAGGGFSLRKIRESVLDAYASSERTSGRHILAFCNDVARYYRSLFIEYKAKVDNEDKEWSTRNLKLRHSRKMWYFSTIIAIAATAQCVPKGRLVYREQVLDALDRTPIERALFALTDSNAMNRYGFVLDNYSWFLSFMRDTGDRDRLSKIKHANRFDTSASNPFPHLKLNSDLMHKNMLALLDDLPLTARERVFDWFLL